MTGPHRYDITLKKGDLRIALSSDDEGFISRQMDHWFRTLLEDAYFPPAFAPPPSVVPSPAAPDPEPVALQSAQPVMTSEPVAVIAPPPVAVSAPTEPPVALAPEPSPEPEPEPLPAEPEPVAAPEATPVAAVSAPEPTPPLPVPEPLAPPLTRSLESEPAADDDLPPPPVSLKPPGTPASDEDFERVLDTLMEDLDPEAARLRKLPTAVLSPPPTMAPAPAAAESPLTSSEVTGVIDSLSDLCERVHPASSEEWLLSAAYYLTFFDGEERFSLKRLNSLLVKSGQSPLNHSVLETAVSKGLLTLAPDVTGLAEAIEYALAPAGREQVEALMHGA